LVQSAFITPDEEMRTLSEMWSQTEKTNKSAIQEHKLRVVYIAAEDGANGIPEENEDMEQSRIEESVSVSSSFVHILVSILLVVVVSVSDLFFPFVLFSLLSTLLVICQPLGECAARWDGQVVDREGKGH
jgi:hypothetical protein